MCADFLNLGAELDALKAGGIEYLHIDIMDGVFVQNYTLGTDFIKKLHAATDIPLDIHLMIKDPETKLDWFDIREGDYVAIHYEACTHHQAVLSKIKSKGGKTMLALNPGTPLCVLEELLPDLDAVLIMTVNPGFAGQKMVPHSIEKIARVREFLDSHGRADTEIEVDGNVSIPNAKMMKAAGANIFVAGTSAVFMGDSIEANVENFRQEVYR
jgi:ribulose-phosphate 3-epimerase